MNLSHLPKAKLVKMLHNTEHDLWAAQEKVDDLRAQRDEIQDALREYRRCPVRDILQQLTPLVEALGTWWERDIVYRAIEGDDLNQDDRERLNILGIQFLHQLVM